MVIKDIEITRQIVLDTETTGINQSDLPYKGHRIIEIGAVEIVNRRLTGKNFHTYLKPDRSIDPEAFKVHGISESFLLNKPTFEKIADDFLIYIHNSELIAHNAPFDIGFLDYELSKLNRGIPKINTFCKITDSLVLAKKMFPGKKNNIDMLCSRYKIDNSKRVLHSALFDAQILANIYLAMTGGQISLFFDRRNESQNQDFVDVRNTSKKLRKLRVLLANDKEIIEHESLLSFLQEKSGVCLWRNTKTQK